MTSTYLVQMVRDDTGESHESYIQADARLLALRIFLRRSKVAALLLTGSWRFVIAETGQPDQDAVLSALSVRMDKA